MSETLQGHRVEIEGDAELLREAVEQAFDYRGDVTLVLDEGEEVSGFLFNRDFEAEPATITLFPKGEDEKRTIEAGRVTAIDFSGRDMAHGKSFEAWLKRYEKKKREEAEAETSAG